MQKDTIRHILGIALCAAVLPLLSVSCIYDDGIDEELVTDTTPVKMDLTISTRAILSDEYIYEVGSVYENYIDIAGGDYRIYFFDANKKFIARFEPDGFVELDEDSYTEYRVQGDVPYALGSHSEFYIMVLANWGNTYDDTSMAAGTTTIDDVCSATWSQYTHKTDFTLGPDNLMPFFGIRHYTDVTFKSNVATLLNAEPILMLRAMAKVEVILAPDDDDVIPKELTSVKICNYNQTGYCAPINVYSQDDYYEGSWLDLYYNNTWDKDEDFKSVHLVGGANDGQGNEMEFNRVQKYDAASSQLETWVAYVPEYDNISSETDYSYISVDFTYIGTQETAYIYFANYTDGKTDNTDTGNRFNIMRNYLYRFKVSIVKGYLRVKPNVWENEWENNFEFGSSTDTDSAD